VPSGLIDDPKHWRSRAAEMRMLADEMSDESARTIMLKLANDYDKLGDRAEERSSKRPQPDWDGDGIVDAALKSMLTAIGRALQERFPPPKTLPPAIVSLISRMNQEPDAT
jgi:hypothetical protein